MGSKNYEEYQQLVSSRNYWETKRNTCADLVRDLEEKAAALHRSIEMIQSCAEKTQAYISKIKELPEWHSGWKGICADSCFSECVMGTFYQSCHGFQLEMESVLQEAEAGLSSLRLQLDSANDRLRNATVSYYNWNIKVASYWA